MCYIASVCYLLDGYNSDNSYNDRNTGNLYIHNPTHGEQEPILHDGNSEQNITNFNTTLKSAGVKRNNSNETKVGKLLKQTVFDKTPICTLQENVSVSQQSVQNHSTILANASFTNSHLPQQKLLDSTFNKLLNESGKHQVLINHWNQISKVKALKIKLHTKTYTKGGPPVDLFQYWLDTGEIHCEKESELEAFPKFVRIKNIIIDRRLGTAPSGGERVADVLRQKEAKEFVKMRPGFFEVNEHSNVTQTHKQ